MEICSGKKKVKKVHISVSVLVPNLAHYVWQGEPHVLQTYPSVLQFDSSLVSEEAPPTPEPSGRENLSIRGLLLHTNY